MKNLVSIKRGRFLGWYADGRNARRGLEDTFLTAGALAGAGLPQAFLIAYGGFVPLLALSAVAAAGLLWGLSMFNRRPAPPPSFLGARRAARGLTGADAVSDKAA